MQKEPGPIGELINAIRENLAPWLGNPTWKGTRERFTLHYGFDTSFSPVSTRRLKIEINTREHFAVYGLRAIPFAVVNPWFTGNADVTLSISSLTAACCFNPR